jgi:acetate kinase
MDKKFLVVNLGSTSKRYSLFHSETEVYSEKFDNNYNISELLKELTNRNLISDVKEISAVITRVVAPGLFFTENRIIDATYIKNLKNAEEIASLHLKPLVEELDTIKKYYKGKIIGISDSKFHTSMPEINKIYSIPQSEAKKYEIYRYGYHGISLASILTKVNTKRAIVCHLGGGSSITAIKDGKSFDTSMGFTPLEGLPGATRSGSIDPNAVLYLNKSKEFFNFESGFEGLTKKSDLREILKLMEQGNKDAKLAIEQYVSQIKKYIGAYAASMNGVEKLVFTGAIGEKSKLIRELVCEDMEFLGINLDKTKNSKVEEGEIQTSGTKILVIKTNENKQMIKESVKFL